MVVLIGLNATLRMFCIKAKLRQSLQHATIDWYAVEAYNDSAVQGDICHLLAPLMREDLINIGPFRCIYT